MEIGKKKIIVWSAFFILAGSLILSADRARMSVKVSIFSDENSNSAEAGKVKGEENINAASDADNDMIPERVEKAVGSNFEKKDTDADGYDDFEEIKNGYSPVISSPSGKLYPEEFAALKEKIRSADQVFYEKIFFKQSPPVASVAPIAPISPVLSGPAVFKEEVSLSNRNWRYSFYAPADIDMSNGQALVIGLHGFGGKAKDYIKFWQSDADANGFLVAALHAYPKTYPNGGTVESYPWLEISDFAKAVLANVEKKYIIDENKIFLTGYSAGASSAYIIVLDSGIKFKGVIPIGGYLPLEAGIIDKLSKARDVNFYVVHGADDIDAKAAINQEKILLQYGAKMEFKTLKGIGHEYPAAEHENILKWMEGLTK